MPDGRGVLVKVLRVGVDGTDKEINAAEYGAAPPGYDFLVTGHESFGQVVEVGPERDGASAVGDYVVATVRRPGSSIYDLIGTNDMTTDDMYYERGINLRHGYLTEYYVDDPEYIVKIPPGLKDVGVLLEPTTVVEKGIAQAYEIQRRLRVWRPRRAAVLGAGTIGLLAALVLRLRGLEVTVFGRTAAALPQLRPDREAGRPLRVHRTTPVGEGCRRVRAVRSDLRGHGCLAGRVREHAGARQERRAGAGQRHRRRPDDRGAGRPDQPGVRAGQQGDGRTVNANREYFEAGVKRHDPGGSRSIPAGSRSCSPIRCRGWRTGRSCWTRSTTAKGAIKVYCEVAEDA